ncbi:MAG: alpha/beta hydrolase [Ruminococcaceae bacterium]|nr:alpha/beta hydrolase [Oscillospiraceae bacterium]
MKFFTHEIKVGEFCAPLRAYLPDGAPHGFFKSNRPAIIVFPGGGYSLTYGGEAEPIALAYAAAGFCAFVLDYSVYPARFPQALLEGLRSIRFVREKAEEYGIDPNRISVCGFSAGGHLAACTGTLWNHKCLDGLLEGDRTLYRPNTLVLSYPVINPLHRGSFLNLFSKNEDELTEEVVELLSLEYQVSSDTPPTFLWHNSDDAAVPVESSLVFGLALTRNKIPFEMRIWESGGHGCCLGTYVTKEAHRIEAPLDCHAWVSESVKFLLRH